MARGRKVVEHGAAELIEAVKQGDVSVSDAAKTTKKAPSKERQRRAVHKVQRGDAKNLTQALRQLDDEDRAAAPIPESADAQVIEGDALEVVAGLTSRPHLVLTDPPYGLDTHRTRQGGQDYAHGPRVRFNVAP